MDEFTREFLSGFGWLMLRRFAKIETDADGQVTFVGLRDDVGEEQLREFPRAAQLAFLSTRDSVHEIRSRQGGTGMNELYKTLQAYVPAGALLLALQRVTEEENAST